MVNRKILFVVTVIAILTLSAAGAWAGETDATISGSVVKWSQPPDMKFGVNIQSTEPEPIVADDWQCRDPRPVTDVHFWGSYIGWEEQNPNPPLQPPGVNGFVIRIYKDVPVGPNQPYSHPGELLYEEKVWEFDEWYVASIPRPDDETYEHKFYYSLDLPRPFDQVEDTIYWISIAAIIPPDGYYYPWGWETSDVHWNDNACGSVSGGQLWDEITPNMLPPWYPHETVDMAFELTVPYEPPPNTKWVQLPDLTPNGIDIKVDDDVGGLMRTLADDFECTFPSLLTDVHFWGSWKNDRKGNITNIHLSIHSDDPIGPGGTNPYNNYSMPDELLWARDFSPDEFDEMLYYTMPDGSYEWWWDPVTGNLTPYGDTQVWRYDIKIDPDEAFHQNGSEDDPVIYWLDISVKTEPDEFEFGWKTRQWPDHFMDDAVYWDRNGWMELRYPPGHPYHRIKPNSIDMAFMLTFEEVSLDWGDAPDNMTALGYPTLASSNGARHVIMPGFHLGRTIRVSQESTPGAGDFDANILGYVSPYVTADTTAGYYQYDTPYGASFNGPAPALTSDRSHLFLADTADGLSLFVVHDKPVDGSGGTTTMHWTLAGDTAGVLALDDPGEPVTVGGGGTIFDSSHVWSPCCTDGMAFGSLDGGWMMIGAFTNAISSTGMNAWHVYASDGSSIPLAFETDRRVRLDYQCPIDPEPDGQPHPYALGDDNDGNDDENGVVFNTPPVPGKPAQVTVTASAPGVLQGWIDFDADSSWADPGEQIFVDRSLVAGPNVLTFSVPATAAIGRTFARFRFSTVPGLPFYGSARDGEVEDYMVWIRCDCGDVDCSGTVNIMDVRLLMNNVSCSGYHVDPWTGDVTGNGVIDSDDVQLLVAHVFDPAGHPLTCNPPVCS